MTRTIYFLVIAKTSGRLSRRAPRPSPTSRLLHREQCTQKINAWGAERLPRKGKMARHTAGSVGSGAQAG